ncbi:MAG: hypothetical protein ABI402_08135 [Ferruginibacter sp.]
MIQEHLSDEKIQEYILQGETDERISLHISGCVACKQKMKAYSVLIKAVNFIEPAAFTFNVSKLVMQKIGIQRKKEKTELYLFYALLSGGILVPIYFILPMIATIFKRIQSLHNTSMALIITVTLGVILFLIADIFRTQKEKELQLSL